MRRHRADHCFALHLGATFISLLLFACGKAEPEPQTEEPSAVIEGPPSAPAAAVAAPAKATATRRQQAEGRWCLRSMGDSERSVLDGSTWHLNADDTYVWEGVLTTSGTWTLIGDKLSLSHAGEHKVIELDADHMVLERMMVPYNLFRECGPEIDQARRVKPLREAAANGDLLMLKALLDKGIDVNAVDRLHSREHTPLIAAIDGGHVDVVTRLLARGASVTVLSGQDETVFEYARRNKPDEMMPLLLAKLPKPASFKVPALLKKPPTGGACPPDYVATMSACVHSYALPRPTLQNDLWDFKADAEPIFLTDWDRELRATTDSIDVAVAPASSKIDYSDLSKLDPGALMNPNAPSPSTTKPAYTETAPSKRLTEPKRNTPKPSKVDWNDDEPVKPVRDDSADRERRMREMCAQYGPALERARNEPLPAGAAQLGFTKQGIIAGIEANIRTCRAKGF